MTIPDADPIGDDAAAAEPVRDDLVLLEEVEDELVLPVWEPTGQPQVDAALDHLTALDPDDVQSHPDVFDRVHQELRAALTDLDAASS